MALPSSLVTLCGLGCLMAGTVCMTAAAFSSATPALPSGAALTAAAAPAASAATTSAPSVQVRLVAGPALVGVPAEVRLLLASRQSPPGTAVAVTDLIPPGMTYVPGSSRLALAGRRVAVIADPAALPSIEGTLLVWPSVTAPAGSAALSLALDPAGPGAPAASRGAAGTAWSDSVTVYGRPSGGSAPPLTGAGLPVQPGTLIAAATLAVTSVDVRASETGVVTTGAQPGAERLVERLAVQSTPAGPTGPVTVRVYFRGTVTWAGCVTAAGCAPPTVRAAVLPVRPGQPDRPLLSSPPVTTGVTGTGGLAGDRGSAVPAPFTVLTWRLGTVGAGTARSLGYRLEAAPTLTPRRADLVTAAAPTAGASGAGLVATTVQPWPSSPAPAATRPDGASTPGRSPSAAAPVPVVKVIAASAGSTTTAASTTTSTSSTTSTTVYRTPRNPFTATGSGTTTTTSSPTSTSTTTTGSTSLASTGVDTLGPIEAGLVLTGGGAVLVVGARGRRSRRRRAAGSPGVDEGPPGG